VSVSFETRVRGDALVISLAGERGTARLDVVRQTPVA
jgi:hypothetical protein